MATWRLLSDIDPRRLREARLQAHYAAQWLARAARAYVPVQPHDGHTNLGWDDQLSGLITHPLSNGERVSLQIDALTLTIVDPYGAGPARTFALSGRTDAEVRAWLGRELSGTGLDAAALDAPPPYEMPLHAIANGARYISGGLRREFEQLSFWYVNGNTMLSQMQQELRARKVAAPPVRCWPHHFDLDTLVAFGEGEGARSMGVGLSPGDHYYDEPYFYVSLYPGPDVAVLGRLPAIAHWHAKDFTGAIIPAHKIVRVRDQAAQVEAALRAAIETAIKALA